MTLHSIDVSRDRVAEFCRANRIRRLALFGSVLRDDFSPESDVDVLVEFQPGARVGYLAIVRMAREFGAMIGRNVDMRTPAELHPAFREEVIREALTEYDAA